MADVKWSDDAEFIPQSQINTGDQIMGLSAANKNIKILATTVGGGDVAGPSSSTENAVAVFDGTTGKAVKNSVVIVTPEGDLSTPGSITVNNLNVSGIANLINTTPNQAEVSLSGDDTTGDGSWWRPYKTVEYTDSLYTDLVNIQAGEFDETAISMASSAWQGQGKDVTKVNCGYLIINDDSWATLAPYKLLQNMTVFTDDSGGVIEVNVTNGGTGYTSAPTVSFTGGDGSGATAVATIGSTITSVTVTNAGTYLTIPTISATIGTGAVFQATMKAQAASVVTPGTNYSVNQKITVQGGTTVGSIPAVLNVTSIDLNGGVTGLSVDTAGEYSALPTNPISDADAYTAVRCATTSPMIGFTYTDGPDGGNPGVGATIANNGIAAQFQADGVIPAVGEGVLVWTMGDNRLNGIYEMTINDAGTGNWEMVRRTDFDEPLEITRYNRLSVTSGTTYGGTKFYVSSARPVQIGTGGSLINFSPDSGTGFTFNIYNWGLQAINVTTPGSGYTDASTLVISGGGGGAGTINLSAGGSVTSVTVTDPGSGYTNVAPTVVFTGGGGTDAAATAVISQTGGAFSFYPTTYKSGSGLIFRNVRLPTNAIIGNISSVSLTDDCESENLLIENVFNTNIDSPLTGALYIRRSDQENVTSMDLELNGLNIELLIVDNSTAAPIIIRLTNCSYLSEITGDGTGLTILIDDVSYPDTFSMTNMVIQSLTNTLKANANNIFTGNNFFDWFNLSETDYSVMPVPVALNPGAIINQCFNLDPSGPGETLTLPDADAVLDYLVGIKGADLVPFQSFSTRFVNISGFDVVLAPGAGMLLDGMVSDVVYTATCVDIHFIFTNVTSGTAEITLTGGQLAPFYNTLPTVVTATTQQIEVGMTYIANSATLLTFTLPATANVGESFKIIGQGVGGFKIAQNSGDQILFLNQATTTGTGGSISTSTNQYQTIEIHCLDTGLYSVTSACGIIWSVV